MRVTHESTSPAEIEDEAPAAAPVVENETTGFRAVEHAPEPDPAADAELAAAEPAAEAAAAAAEPEDGAPGKLSRRQLERMLAQAQQEKQQAEGRLRAVLPQAQTQQRQLVEARLTSKEGELATLRKTLADALETGDTATVVDAQVKLNEVQFDLTALRHAKQRAEAQSTQQPRPAPRPAQQGPSAKAVAWADRNPWFGKETSMTGAAYAIDASLKDEGYVPDSEAYYRELDRRLATDFPGKIGGQQPRRSSPVAGVPGQTRGRRAPTLQLSDSEKAMARRLGVPYERYAAFRK
jgi:hypothetical protein